MLELRWLEKSEAWSHSWDLRHGKDNFEESDHIQDFDKDHITIKLFSLRIIFSPYQSKQTLVAGGVFLLVVLLLLIATILISGLLGKFCLSTSIISGLLDRFLGIIILTIFTFIIISFWSDSLCQQSPSARVTYLISMICFRMVQIIAFFVVDLYHLDLSRNLIL